MADAGKAMMLYKGVYEGTYTYEKLDVVNYNGSLYISTTDGNLGTEPTDETNWKLFLQGGIADNIQATDTHGMLGEAGSSSFVQLLLDSLASKVGKDDKGNTISSRYLGKTGGMYGNTAFGNGDITTWGEGATSTIGGKTENVIGDGWGTLLKIGGIRPIYLLKPWNTDGTYIRESNTGEWKRIILGTNVLATMEEVEANTSSVNVAGAKAVSELKNNMPGFIDTASVLKNTAISASGSYTATANCYATIYNFGTNKTGYGAITKIDSVDMFVTLEECSAHPLVPLKKGQVFSWNAYAAGTLRVYGMG